MPFSPPALSPSDTLPPPPQRPPRVWTVYFFFLVTLVGMLAVSALVLIISFWIEHRPQGMPRTERLLSYATEPHVLILSMCTTALLLSTASLCAAYFSRQPLRERLGLQRSHFPRKALLFAILGAPALGAVLETLVLLLGIEPSGTLKLISDSILRAEGIEIPLFVVAITVGPAIGEEFVFRGYIQSRLVMRHGPGIGIFIAGTLFGLLHMDPLQSPLAAILGLYIGVIAYRFGSILPAILTHAFNNFLSITLLLIFSETEPLQDPDLLTGGLSLLFFIYCLHHVLQLPQRQDPDQTQGGLDSSSKLGDLL